MDVLGDEDGGVDVLSVEIHSVVACGVVALDARGGVGLNVDVRGIEDKDDNVNGVHIPGVMVGSIVASGVNTHGGVVPGVVDLEVCSVTALNSNVWTSSVDVNALGAMVCVALLPSISICPALS